MQTDWIKIMKETGKLKLSFWNYVNYYFIVVFMLLIPIFSLISVFEIYVTKTYDGVRPTSELLSFSLPWIIPAVLFFFIQKHQLKFKKIDIQYSDDEFREAIERTVKDLEWKIERNNKTYFRARRPWNWTSSWGEMITIIKLKEGFLINSIGDPNAWGSGFGYGWNRKNIKTFIKHLTETKQGLPFIEKEEKIENEWSLKRIAVRLFMYTLSAIIITAGLFAIYSSTIRGIIAGIASISIVSIWIYSDIKMIKNQKKARKHNKGYKSWRGNG